MKPRRRIPSPATIIAIIALFVALGGTAYGVARNSVGTHQIQRHAIHAKNLGAMKLRWGRVVDFDHQAGDGQYNIASGRARCHRGERLISGGVRYRRSPQSGPLRVALIDSGPMVKTRQWAATWHSDLGGAARNDFVVFAYCLMR